MALNETNHIERVVLAFRGDTDGAYKGGHVERFRVITSDGQEIVRQPGRATTIGEAAGAGFTWPDVAAEINAGLVIAYDEAQAQIAALNAEKAALAQAHAEQLAALASEKAATAQASAAQLTALNAEKTTAEQARDAAQAQVQTLQAQLDALVPPAINGVPQEVTMRQAQLALLGAGLLDTVDTAIAAIPGDAGRAARITWEKSSAVRRDNPLIAQLQGALGLTSEQIDALFVAAAAIR